MIYFTLVVQATVSGTWSQEPLYSLSPSSGTLSTLSHTSVDYSLAHIDLSSTPSNPAYPLVQEDKFSGSNNPAQSTN